MFIADYLQSIVGLTYAISSFSQVLRNINRKKTFSDVNLDAACTLKTKTDSK